jgi:hypothetical protein
MRRHGSAVERRTSVREVPSSMLGRAKWFLTHFSTISVNDMFYAFLIWNVQFYAFLPANCIIELRN